MHRLPESITRPIFSLYRSLVRQSRLLPTEYLRQFFRLKFSDDVRATLDATFSRRRRNRTARLRKLLRKLRGANEGRPWDFDDILDLGYGRVGKLRREIIEPVLSNPSGPLRERIIPAVESSRPPSYSPELTALLTNILSRYPRALHAQQLLRPPTMPLRTDPKSEAAQLLGPFSKRREVNLHWRYFTDQRLRIRPPIQIVLAEHNESGEVVRTTDPDSIRRAGIRPIGFQGAGVYEEVAAIAAMRPRPRKAGDTSSGEIDAHGQPLIRSHLPHRFVRRRFQFLLGRMPVMTYMKSTGQYKISASPDALMYTQRGEVAIYPVANDADLAWMQLKKSTGFKRMPRTQVSGSDSSPDRTRSTTGSDIPRPIQLKAK